MFRAMIAAWGTIDILVSNAGLQQDATLVDMTLEQWNIVLGVNLTGIFLCAREAAREMIRRGPRPEVSRATGKIICMSSVHERIPWAGHVNYAASKGGMMLFMQSAGPGAGARTGSGSTRSDPAPSRRRSTAPRGRRRRRSSSSSRSSRTGAIGQPEDIGRAAVWLASDDSDYVHGQTLFVDGGMTLYPEFAHGG